jgi:hypothetical protein
MTAIPYLFLVHPGSALGSATFNLGSQIAQCERMALTNEIAAWDGHLIILSGLFDDEIADYPMFAEAIRTAKQRGRDHGRIVETRDAPDPDQSEECLTAAAHHAIPKDARIVCTGAWASLGTSGCVNSVRDALKTAGYTNVHLSETAVYEPEDDEFGLEAA